MLTIALMHIDRSGCHQIIVGKLCCVPPQPLKEAGLGQIGLFSYFFTLLDFCIIEIVQQQFNQL